MGMLIFVVMVVIVVVRRSGEWSDDKRQKTRHQWDQVLRRNNLEMYRDPSHILNVTCLDPKANGESAKSLRIGRKKMPF